ncbi:hypothetical protein HKCCE2091_15390 [Rhodobacterales bacterium HKCCE2091]|nr:hypothetical protein [Rhodobacterales bacterium HKCCE2091]
MTPIAAGATPPAARAADDPVQGRRRRFLERHTYRRYRLEDAARLVPVLGAFLFFGPVAILTTETGIGGGTSGWLIYFITVWFGLICLAAALSRALMRRRPPDEAG